MGFSDLFKEPEPPHIMSILPDAAQNEILAGRLPILNTNRVFLKSGEHCHYIDKAIYEQKNVGKRYVSNSTGYSFPGMFKGTRVSFSNGNTDVVDNVTYSTHRGILYITNRRIIFQGEQNGFDRRIDELVAINTYSNCVELQFSKEQYKTFVPSGNIAHLVLQLVR